MKIHLNVIYWHLVLSSKRFRRHFWRNRYFYKNPVHKNFIGILMSKLATSTFTLPGTIRVKLWSQGHLVWCFSWYFGKANYSRGFKKRAIAEIMFETLAIFYVSLKCYFSSFFFLFGIRGQLFCMWVGLFRHSAHMGRQRRPKSWTFF